MVTVTRVLADHTNNTNTRWDGGKTKARGVLLHGNYQKRRLSKGASCLEGDTKARNIHTILLFGNVERFSCVARFRGFFLRFAAKRIDNAS